MPRDTIYTPEIVKEICDLLSEGMPLEQICRMPGMPAAYTVHDWKSANQRPAGVPESVATDIARARELGYDAIAAQTRETARGRGDSTDDVQRDKLIIETDLKLLAKWTRKYSEKQTHEHAGVDGQPIKTEVIVRYVDSPVKDA